MLIMCVEAQPHMLIMLKKTKYTLSCLSEGYLIMKRNDWCRHTLDTQWWSQLCLLYHLPCHKPLHSPLQIDQSPAAISKA